MQIPKVQVETSLKARLGKFYQIKPFPSLAQKCTISCWVGVLK